MMKLNLFLLSMLWSSSLVVLSSCQLYHKFHHHTLPSTKESEALSDADVATRLEILLNKNSLINPHKSSSLSKLIANALMKRLQNETSNTDEVSAKFTGNKLSDNDAPTWQRVPMLTEPMNAEIEVYDQEAENIIHISDEQRTERDAVETATASQFDLIEAGTKLFNSLPSWSDIAKVGSQTGQIATVAGAGAIALMTLGAVFGLPISPLVRRGGSSSSWSFSDLFSWLDRPTKRREPTYGEPTYGETYPEDYLHSGYAPQNIWESDYSALEQYFPQDQEDPEYTEAQHFPYPYSRPYRRTKDNRRQDPGMEYITMDQVNKLASNSLSEIVSHYRQLKGPSARQNLPTFAPNLQHNPGSNNYQQLKGPSARQNLPTFAPNQQHNPGSNNYRQLNGPTSRQNLPTLAPDVQHDTGSSKYPHPNAHDFFYQDSSNNQYSGTSSQVNSDINKNNLNHGENQYSQWQHSTSNHDQQHPLQNEQREYQRKYMRRFSALTQTDHTEGPEVTKTQ